jgi:hypothetical protein
MSNHRIARFNMPIHGFRAVADQKMALFRHAYTLVHSFLPGMLQKPPGHRCRWPSVSHILVAVLRRGLEQPCMKLRSDLIPVRPGERQQVRRRDLPMATGWTITLERAGFEPLADFGLANAEPLGGIARGNAFDVADENGIRRLDVALFRWQGRQSWRRILLPLALEALDFGTNMRALVGASKKALRLPRSAVVVKMARPDLPQFRDFSVECGQQLTERRIDYRWR